MMIHRPNLTYAGLLALVLLAPIGCGRKAPVAEVSGVVMLDGQPAPEMAVDFVPDTEKGTRGPPSSGSTDEQGKFDLVCDDGRGGAVIGFHRVIVKDIRSVPGPPNRAQGRNKGQGLLPSRISSVYTVATSTPLREEVKAEPQTITLKLTKLTKK
jgi:hypothetical protein